MWELKQHPANSLKCIPSCRWFILFYLIYLCMHLLHQPWNFSNLHMQPFLHLLRFSLLAVNDELVGLILLVGKKKIPIKFLLFFFHFTLFWCQKCTVCINLEQHWALVTLTMIFFFTAHFLLWQQEFHLFVWLVFEKLSFIPILNYITNLLSYFLFLHI